jgi:hypothetical protein
MELEEHEEVIVDIKLKNRRKNQNVTVYFSFKNEEFWIAK